MSAAFIERLRSEGARRYHDAHPFHVAMHEGQLSRDELRLWVRNRYYYQTRIPIKDAIILSKSEDPVFRRRWAQRLSDHDGRDGDESAGPGGIDLWRRLAGAVGVDQAELADRPRVLPGVRFACDAYVDLVRSGSLLEAVASSLTEAFAPDLMQRRITALRLHYPWIPPESLAYFEGRIPRARRDAEHALAFVVEHARSDEDQDRCVAALVRKTEILWHLLDCVWWAARTHIPA